MKDPIAVAYHDFQLLGIDRKTAKTLVENNILTVRDLTSLTEADIIFMPGLGQKSLFVLKKYVRKLETRIRRKDRPTTILTTFTPDVFHRMLRWMDGHGTTNHAEAVRRLVELGLGATGKE